MLRREPIGGTLYHAYAKSVENLDANFTNKMAANYLQNCNIPIIIGTVSAKIAPRFKCYNNASRLNRYNFPTDNAIDFLFSTLHIEMV